MRTFLAIALGVACGVAFYAAFHVLAAAAFSAPTNHMGPWLAFGAPLVSLLLCGLVSAVVAPQRWSVVSVSSGAVGTLMLLWFFSASGHWFFFSLALVLGLAISFFGGLLGSRIPVRVHRAP